MKKIFTILALLMCYIGVAASIDAIAFKPLSITDEEPEDSIEWYNVIDESQPYVFSVYKSLEDEIAGISRDELYDLVKEVPATEEGAFAYTTTGFNKEDYQTTDKNGNDISGNYRSANQLFITSPEPLCSGETVRIHFAYRADKNAKTDTQAHDRPTCYRHYSILGEVYFCEEWKTLEKQITISDVQDGMRTIAFELNHDVQEENTFYLKDIKIEKIKLEEGLFVTAANTETGLIDYDFRNVVPFEYDDEVMVAIVGTEGDPNTWVNEIMISTVRGNEKRFKKATLKPQGNLCNEWISYEYRSEYRIKLPAAGVYKISVNQDEEIIAITQIEGEVIPGNIGNEPNGIEVVEKAAAPKGSAVKAIVNDKVVIIKNGKRYNVGGEEN